MRCRPRAQCMSVHARQVRVILSDAPDRIRPCFATQSCACLAAGLFASVPSSAPVLSLVHIRAHQPSASRERSSCASFSFLLMASVRCAARCERFCRYCLCLANSRFSRRRASFSLPSFSIYSTHAHAHNTCAVIHAYDESTDMARILGRLITIKTSSTPTRNQTYE